MSSSSVSLGRNLVSLKWEDFNVFVMSELAALYQKDDLTDVTLFCEGRSFRAHKVLLSLWSSYFRDVFRSTNHAHPVVILKETNSSDLEMILRFVYQGHLLIPIEETDRFLKAAEYFQVAGLKNMRHHVPNFPYSAGNSNNTVFNEETNIHSQVHNVNPPPAYEGPPKSYSNPSTVTISPSSNPHIQHSHVRTVSSISCANLVVNPHHTPSVQPSSSNVLNIAPGPPQPSQNTPSSEPVVISNSIHHHPHPEESPGHHQVIRQGSIRPTKHASISTGFQPNIVIPSSSSSVGVVTRLASDSVIYQPQPVLIFQNPTGPQPIIKPGEPYVARISGDSRPEQSMMVIDGVVGESQIHIDPTPPSSHIPTSSSQGYTVYSHSPNHNPHIQHTSPEVSGSEEAILGLPYEPPIHRDNLLSQHNTHDPKDSDSHHHHSHHHIHQHGDTHPKIIEAESESVGSYSTSASSSSSLSFESIGNATGTPQPMSKGKSSSVNSEASAGSSGASSQPVYAVKRVPPLLPSASSSGVSQPKKSVTISNRNSIQSGKKTLLGGPGQEQRNVSAISTRSSDLKTDINPNSRSNPSTSHGINNDFKSGKSLPATTSHRKVALVPCPKCGKKVKQTSLKVHMKRTHLEEGTVLVCPICSKRISSKGVYYKHMYLHRKRSEGENKPSSGSFIKNETQGT